MGIDFHSRENRSTYTTREADPSWIGEIKKLASFEQISRGLDIGCGGGIYCKALSDMGVHSVTGIDFSEAIIEGAKDNCKQYESITFKHGNALETGLKSNHYQLILSRALIHHIEDLHSCFNEAYRLLEPGGTIIIQDRTPDDCFLKGDYNHIRGYFFELFPRLMEEEKKRRHDSDTVISTLMDTRFHDIQEIKLWETRRVYENKGQLRDDLLARSGRSILHELDNEELIHLANYIDQTIPEGSIVEKDRWTIWKAIK